MLRFVRRGGDNQLPIGDLPQWLSSILRNRGVDTPEKAERFLHPALEQLHDPMAMEGMEKAVTIIRQAVSEQTPIMIYGDYDADGVCATTVMMKTLRKMGANVRYRIPDRHGEGYGLNCGAVREIAKEAKLLITVDCGVTNHEEVRLAQLLGMTVIVTDHHQLAETPSPADVVLNPLMGDYPFRRLCGAGVALKVTQALLGSDAVKEIIDLAALATVADIVPLIDENRVIVRYGLEKMNGYLPYPPEQAQCLRPGLAALMTLADVKQPVTSDQLAYRVAPRINAGGRLEHAGRCVELLLTEDNAEAQTIAAELHALNEKRHGLQAQITNAAEESIRESVDFREDQIIIVMGEEWESGVIGLAAGRICEKYHFPTIVLSKQGDMAVGSCRSIPGVNIHAMLTACADLFTRFGGHEQAAGLTMRADWVPELRRRLNLVIREKCDLSCYIPSVEYDAALPLAQVDLALIERLALLQPTGFGNPAPVFLTCGAQVQQIQLKGKGKIQEHLGLTLLEGTALRSGIAFYKAAMARNGLEAVDVLYTPEANEFRGHVSAQLNVKELRVAEGTVRMPADEALFQGVLQEISLLAENNIQIPAAADDAPAKDEKPATKPVTVSSVTMAGLKPLLKDGRGVLLLAHERTRAAEVAAQYACDSAVGCVEDRLGYNTLLVAPALDQLTDLWQHIVLLDGDLLPGEATMLLARCPHAQLHAMKPNAVFQQLIMSLYLERDAMGNVYKCARSIQRGAAAGEVAQATGLTVAQAATGLRVFAQLQLMQEDIAAQRYAVIPGAPKNPLDNSTLYCYCRQLAGKA